MPDFGRVAAAFGFKVMQCREQDNLDNVISEALASAHPTLCEIFLDEAQAFSPKLSSRILEDGTMSTPTLEDMAPFLDRETLSEIMNGG